MSDWLGSLATNSNRYGYAFAALLFVGSFVGSLLLAALVAVRLPADYFVVEERPLPLAGCPMVLRVAARVLRNLAGLCLIVMGVMMSLPGVPGQGLLTILFGVMLTDLPGKRRLELSLVRRSLIRNGIAKLRLRYNKPPLVLPLEKDGAPEEVR